MAVMSSGRVGDQVKLTSVLHKFHKQVSLTFDYYLQESRPETSGSLSVYLLSKQHFPMRLRFGEFQMSAAIVSSVLSGRWKRDCVHIPSGTYHVMFLATLGLPYHSDIYLDNIQVLPNDFCSGNNIEPTGNFTFFC